MDVVVKVIQFLQEIGNKVQAIIFSYNERE